MASAAKVFADLLVTAAVGTLGAETGWSINVSREPASPDTCITLYDAGGFPPNPQWKINYPSVQVRVRGAKNGYSDAYDKAEACMNALLGLPSQDIGDTRYVSVAMKGFINAIGYDEDNRPILTINFGAITEPTASSNREAL